jgi:patatin-like phospholipase/acyl hydrolase
MVDGGVFANNPATSAYVEAIRLHGHWDTVGASLATGQVKIHYCRRAVGG